jgi:hypothetical protein
MLRSKDGKVTILVTTDLATVPMPAADISFFNIPKDRDAAAALFAAIHNAPSRKHIALFFCRHSRTDRLKALANIAIDKELSYLDTVHLWYEKPSTSSNIGFLPLAEEGFILYKGSTPAVKNTAWFNPPESNASNSWGITAAEHEQRPFSYYRKFAWEIPLLLASMAEPRETERMIYGLDDDHESAFKFCKEYNMSIHTFAPSALEAQKLLDRYESI